jgi:hypothetical protein
MDWEQLYKEYLFRFNSNPGYTKLTKRTPLSYIEFVKLHTKLLNNKKNNELKKKWFDYE